MLAVRDTATPPPTQKMTESHFISSTGWVFPRALESREHMVAGAATKDGAWYRAMLASIDRGAAEWRAARVSWDDQRRRLREHFELEITDRKEGE